MNKHRVVSDEWRGRERSVSVARCGRLFGVRSLGSGTVLSAVHLGFIVVVVSFARRCRVLRRFTVFV